MASQRFCLRWNNHQSNLLSVFDQLLHAETFTDVTLAVEGQFLKAHKMVLSACSPYFQVLFTNTPDDKHPILILKDISLADMKSLLDFMYRGEVSVDQERLTAFLRVAESLRIKGLTEVNEDKQPKGSSTTAATNSGTTSSNSSTVEASATQSKTAGTAGAASNTPPQLHRIQPYVMQQQRKAQGMMLTNPLLGSALTQPKRKRGRPRKMSGSSNEGGDAADFEEFEARENLVQGSPELMEVQMGADGYSDNSDDRDADDNDSENDTNNSTIHRRTSPGDSAAHPKHSKDNTGSRKDHEQSPSDEITPANYATYLRYGLLIPKTDSRPLAATQPQASLQPKPQEPFQPASQQPIQSPDQSSQQMSPPKIRINPMTQNSSQLASALQQLHSESVNNNNNNSSISIRQVASASTTPTTNAQTAATTMANISTSIANTIVSNYLSGQQQQHQMLALQLQQNTQPPAAIPPTPCKPETPTPANQNSNSTTNANNNHSPQNFSSDLNPASPGAPDSTPSTPVTPSGGGTIRPPQRRRVRRKVNSPSDDPAEHLTEMSVRGLDLFRYAKILEGIYQCTECLKENIQKTFKNKYSFQRHAFLYHEGSQRKVFPCPVCNKEFSRPDKMKNHMKTTHDGYVARDAAYPLSFLMGAGGDLPLSMAPFPKLSKAKLAKMEKLEALMMGPHIGGHPALNATELEASEAMLQQQRLLGHRMVDVDDIDDDMDLDEEDLPASDVVQLDTMQSKINDVVHRIQLSQTEQVSRSASPIDTIKVEDSDAAPVSD